MRNGGVQLAQLLKQQHEDLEDAGGALAHRFERMLFLTATPFQLGHAELCNVLSRFEAVAWKGPAAPAMQREAFRTEIAELGQSLDAMQMATERLERTWKRLLPPDLEEAEATFGDAWWEFNAEDENAAGSVANERLGSVMRAHAVAKAAILRAEALLKPWVLRSARSLKLPEPHRDVPRRERLEGASVPVSYTHLDVYKRQQQAIWLPVAEARGRAVDPQSGSAGVSAASTGRTAPAQPPAHAPHEIHGGLLCPSASEPRF